MTLALTNIQIIFIITASVIVLAIVLILLLGPFRKMMIKKKYREYYYHTIYKIAMDKDYFLLNNFLFKIDDNHTALIDHILCGEKYIYLINSYHYDGSLKGEIFDQSLVYSPKKGPKKYTKNHMLGMRKLLERLSMVTNLDQDLFIGIVLVNDEVNLSISDESKVYYMIQRNRLSALIKAIESRNIPMIDQKQLEEAINALSVSSQKLKKKSQGKTNK